MIRNFLIVICSMGPCAAQPLAKVPNPSAAAATKNTVNIAAPKVKKKNMFSPRKSATDATTFMTSETETCVLENTRRYFSFVSFLLQNERPQIYEWVFDKEPIGSGNMCTTYQVTDVNDDTVRCVAKVYNNALLQRNPIGDEDSPHDSVKKEIDIMGHHDCEYLMHLVEAIEDDETNSLILVLPYAKLGTLASLVEDRSLTYRDTLVCLYQTALAIQYLHSQNIVHRNLTPAAIFAFSENCFCLGKFGNVQSIKPGERLHNLRGEIHAPEEHAGSGFDGVQADIWAFGVICYFALFAKYPFDMDDMDNKLRGASFPMTNRELEEHAVPLVRAMLDPNPVMRPTLETIISHPLFAEAYEITSQLSNAQESSAVAERAN